MVRRLICPLTAWTLLLPGAAATIGLLLVLVGADSLRAEAIETDGIGRSSLETKLDPEFGVGSWIWTEESSDKQSARFWRGFDVPSSTAVTYARLRITADNAYRVFLDGRELGRGSDWRWMTAYDLTWLLTPGRHVLAVDAFNDRLQGGLLAGLRLELSGDRIVEIGTDESWRVVPETEVGWETKLHAPQHWQAATVMGAFGEPPWDVKPNEILTLPAFHPFTRHFWQSGWFQVGVIAAGAVALVVCLWLAATLALQAKAQHLLQRERVRIARDIHDDLGAGLTQIILQGEVAQTEFPEDSPVREQFAQLSERARGVAQLLDEVVWAVNSRRDTLRDLAGYVCKYAQTFLSASPIRCRLDVESDLPVVSLDLVVRRNLFLAVKEALNNAAKHSGGTRIQLRIHRHGPSLVVVVEDNGKGFSPEGVMADRHGLTNMEERLKEAGGSYRIHSEPGQGCIIEFKVPLAGGAWSRPRWLRRSVDVKRPAVEASGLGAKAATDSPRSQ